MVLAILKSLLEKPRCRSSEAWGSVGVGESGVKRGVWITLSDDHGSVSHNCISDYAESLS